MIYQQLIFWILISVIFNVEVVLCCLAQKKLVSSCRLAWNMMMHKSYNTLFKLLKEILIWKVVTHL